MQAQRENKIIVPCIPEHVHYNEIKWDLVKIQGVEFGDKYELARNLHSKILYYNSSGKGRVIIPGSYSYNSKNKQNKNLKEDSGGR